LSLDRDRNATIWPADLPHAVNTLREIAARKYVTQTCFPDGTSSSVLNPARTSPNILSSLPQPHLAHLPPSQLPPSALPPHTAHHSGLAYPTAGYMMTPYGAPVPPVRTARNATGRPPNGPGTGSIPSYEEMIVQALTEISDPQGVQPKVVFDYMSSHWPLMTNFRPSASQALQKAFKRGRLQKVGTNYRLNADWAGGSTSKRTNRRPQKMDDDSSGLNATQSSAAGSQWKPPTSLPFPYGPPQPTNPYQSISRTAAAAASSRIPTSQIRPVSNEDDQEEGIGVYHEEGTLTSKNMQFSVPKRPPDNFSLRQNLRTLAKLLRESIVKQEA